MERKITQLIIVALLAFAVILLLVVSASADDLLYYSTNYNYSEVIVPNYGYVHQGENLSQGNTYDLSGVYGWSGILVHWNDPNKIGFTDPDNMVDLNGMRYKRVLIDPETWPVGGWYQFDGDKSNPDDTYHLGSMFGAGNALVFHVVPQVENTTAAVTSSQVVTHSSVISVSQNGQITQIPVTYTEVVTPVPTPSVVVTATPIVIDTPSNPEPSAGEAQDQNGIPINGGVSGAEVVTPRSPVPVWLPVLAIILIALIAGWKR